MPIRTLSHVTTDDEILRGVTERSNTTSIVDILVTAGKLNGSPRREAEEDGNVYAASKDSDRGDAASTSPRDPLQPAAAEPAYSSVKCFVVCISLYSAALLYGLDNTIV
jgi:hypothetical protein